jgi:hypothetical protein
MKKELSVRLTLKCCSKNIKLQQSVHCADLRAKFR